MGNFTRASATVRPSRWLGIVWLGIASIAILVLPEASAARDRPGTPNNERAWVCNRLTELPAVCVAFDNTASEPVRFDIEFTIDGQKILDHRPEADSLVESRPADRHCIGCQPFKYLPDHESEAAYNFNYGNHGTPTRGRTGADNGSGDPLPPQGFKIRGLDYDTTYCFRFKARRASDDIVSEQWSNWACATTAGPPDKSAKPPKPSRPSHVTAEYTPGGKDWRTKPPKVVIRWGPSSDVEYYSLSMDSGGGGPRCVGSAPGAASNSQNCTGIPAGAEREVVDFPREQELASNEWNPTIVYRICAHNISGDACTTKSTFVAPGDSVSVPAIPIGEMAKPKPAFESNRNVPAGAVGLPTHPTPAGSLSNRSAANPAAQSNACRSGYVWRKAQAEDRVCVSPDARSRVSRENGEAASHVDPAGAYGPNTCVAGYVWREAFQGDVVCVTPQSRGLARRENAEGASHRAQ